MSGCPAVLPPLIEHQSTEVQAAAWPVLLEWNLSCLRSLTQGVGMNPQVLGGAAQIEPSVRLALRAEAGANAVCQAIG